jgi:predicted metal-dependent phosphotriesterase family hydrolase
MDFLWRILLDRRRLAVALLLLAGAARAQEAACKAVLAGTRALVDATVHGMLDRDLLRIVKLGLSGRLSVETTVVRRRHLWFGRVVSKATREVPLAWSEERGVLEVDGRPIADPEHIPLERIVLSLGESEDPSSYQVELSTRLVVVTQSSLGRVADLLSSDSDSPLSRTVLSAIANDLVRSASTTCPVEPRR